MDKNKNMVLKKTIKYLQDHISEYVPMVRIANFNGVSTKTLKKYIVEINDLIKEHGAQIKVKSGYGCKLYISDENKYRNYYNETIVTTSQIMNDETQYVHQVVRKFLMGNYIKVDQIIEEVFLSKTLVSQLYKEASSIVNSFDLKIEKNTRKGSILVGSEHNIRSCINYELFFYKNSNTNDIEFKEKYINNSLIASIEQSVIEVEKIYNIKYLDDNSIQHLATSLYIAHQRNKENYNLDYSEEVLDRFSRRNSYIFADALVERLKVDFSLNLQERDKIFVSIFIVANRCFISKEDFPVGENYYECQNLALELVRFLEKENDFRYFSSDQLLIQDLSLNLTQILTQSEFHLSFIKNIEYLKKSLEADLLATQVASFLLKKYKYILSFEQIYYIAMLIYPVFGRYRFEYINVDVLIVSNVNKYIGNGIKERLLRNFKKQIRKIVICDLKELQDIDLSNYAILFSSYSLNQLPELSSTITYNYIDIFFNEKEKERIRKLLVSKRLQKEIGYKKVLGSIDVVKINKQKSKYDVLVSIAKDVVKSEEEYRQMLYAITQYDELNPFPTVNNVVFVTPIMAVKDKPFVKAYVLDKSIRWDSTKVQIVVFWERGRGEGVSNLFENESLPHILYNIFSREEISEVLLQENILEFLRLFEQENDNVIKNGANFR